MRYDVAGNKTKVFIYLKRSFVGLSQNPWEFDTHSLHI